MRRTRFMSLFFLVLALAFFCVPAFRQGFKLPMSMSAMMQGDYSQWHIDAAEYDRWASEAQAAHDASGIAFVALHHPDFATRKRLAEAAVTADAKLTWIYFSLANPLKKNDPLRVEYARKIQLWDPQNALGYLMEGEYIQGRDDKVSWLSLDERAKQTEWRAIMDKAYTAPRYYSYAPERFLVERKYWRSHGRDNHFFVLLTVLAFPSPNLLNLRQYGELLIQKLGKDAEQANHNPEAIADYWKAAHFGERLRLSPELLEQLIGASVQTQGYKALSALFRKQGQNDVPATLDYIAADFEMKRDILRGQELFSVDSNSGWNFFMVLMFFSLIVIFGSITAVAMVYVNAKRWIRPQKKGRLYDFFTTAENYAPIVMFVACAGLYITYYPYSVNYEHYMTATAAMHDFESFRRNVVPLPAFFGGNLEFGNPLVPYAWYALGGLVLVLIVQWVTRGRTALADKVKQTPTEASIKL